MREGKSFVLKYLVCTILHEEQSLGHFILIKVQGEKRRRCIFLDVSPLMSTCICIHMTMCVWSNELNE